MVLSGAEMQIGHGESIADTARVLSRYVDMIMIRTFAEATLLELAGTKNEAEHSKYSPHRLQRSFKTLSTYMGWITKGANSIHTLQVHHITHESYQKLTHVASQILVFVTTLAQKMR